jgi:hypothetical protein
MTTTTIPPSVTTGQTTLPSATTTPPTPPLTPEEQEQQNRLQNVIAATNQNLDETEKQVNGIVYTPRWSDPVWVNANSIAVLAAYCLPGEFAESGQEILGGFELEVLESYEVALPQGFMAWMMVIGNEDRQDRLPAAVGVICASDLNQPETRVLSPDEQQQINNIVQQFTTQVTNIENVINIINNVTRNGTTPTGPVTPPPTNDTGDRGTTPPPGGGGGGMGPRRVPGGGGGIPENLTATAEDTTPPVIRTSYGSNNPRFNTDDPEGVKRGWVTTAEDNVDGTATLYDNNIIIQDNVGGYIFMVCSPPSGSTFSIGNTVVQCTATDAAGNTGRASFLMTVELRPPPTEEALVGEQPPAADEEEAPPAAIEEQPPVQEEEQAPPANEAGGGG